MAKKALSSKFIWGIYVPFGTMILGFILDRSIPQFNLGKLLANIGKGIYHIKIPDFLHVILIIAIFISLVFINKKFQGLSPNKFKEMLAENERIKKRNESLMESTNNIIAVNQGLKTEIEKIRRENKANIEKAKRELLQMSKESENETKKEEKLKPHDEIIFILDVLASQPTRVLEQRNLMDKYQLRFKPRMQADFQIILNDLEINGLIEEVECGHLGEIGWLILPSGIEYLKRNR